MMEEGKNVRNETLRKRIEDDFDYTREKGVRDVSPSEVFDLFYEGFSPMEVVEETDGDPVKIRDWYRAWLDMCRDFSKEGMRKLDRDARWRLAELKELLGPDALKLQGKSPSGLLAAMAYLMGKEEGWNVTQVGLADMYRVSEALVRENVKLLRKLFEEKGLTLVEAQQEE